MQIYALRYYFIESLFEINDAIRGVFSDLND